MLDFVAMPHQTRTLNGKNSMLLCEHNPNSGAAQNGDLFNPLIKPRAILKLHRPWIL